MGSLVHVSKLELDGLLLITPQMHTDERGEFGRIFCKKEFYTECVDFNIKQVNHSITKRKGSLRGMHFQYPPKCESKLVKCVKGKVFDVVVDIRRGSSTFLQWVSVELSEDNRQMLYIPVGFAHGFQTLENNSELIYFHSDYYSPGLEGGLKYNDPILSISWPLSVTETSKRDCKHKCINDEFEGI